MLGALGSHCVDLRDIDDAAVEQRLDVNAPVVDWQAVPLCTTGKCRKHRL